MHRIRVALQSFSAAASPALRELADRLGAAGRRLNGRTGRLSRVGHVLPALLAGAGVFLVVSGLFGYFGPQPSPAPTPYLPIATPADMTLPPLASPSPDSPTPSGSQAAIATRIVIPALGIDLPIVAPPPNELFPLCDTAEYLDMGKAYAYPGMPQATYLYAHARAGMFWPLLATSKINNGASMIGKWVEVYTADNQRHVYEITQVIRHVPNSPAFLSEAEAATTDQLWLQTSEGHADTSNKLQIVAMPIGVVAAANPADAHPASTARVCPDAPVCTAANQGGCRRA